MATSIGRQAEKIAKQFPKNQGLKFIESNFYSRMGEIDLIMQESDTLIFIEVRYRKNTAHGSPLETITPSKQASKIKSGLLQKAT